MPSLRPHPLGGYSSPEDRKGEPQTGTPRVSVTDDEGTVLSNMCRGLAILEIGTGLGVSTRAMARQATLVVTVDIDPWVFKNIIFTEHNIIPVHRNDVQKLALRYQGCFIDAAHDAASVEADIKLALELVKYAPRLIVLHDYAHEAVRRGAEASGLTFQWMKTNYGLGIVRMDAKGGING